METLQVTWINNATDTKGTDDMEVDNCTTTADKVVAILHECNSINYNKGTEKLSRYQSAVLSISQSDGKIIYDIIEGVK